MMEQPLLSTRYKLALIVVLVLLAYSNIYQNEFLWDDKILIHQNENIRDPAKHMNFIRDFWYVDEVNFGSPYHRPLVSMLYIMDFYIWGEESPFGYHLTNVLLIVLASVMVFFAVREITGKENIGFWSGLLFGVHTVHTENITWIAGRTDALMGVFYFAALWMFVRFRHDRSMKYFYYSVLFFTLAMFSKVVAITFPAVIILYDYCFSNGNIRGVIKKWKQYFAYIAAAFFYLFVRYLALGGSNFVFTRTVGEDVIGIGVFSTIMRFLYSMMHYAYISVFPFQIKARYVIPEHFTLIGLESVLVYVFYFALCIALYWFYKHEKRGIFYLLYFFGNVLLVSNLFTLKDSFASRFAYLASFAAVVGIVYFAYWLKEKLSMRHLHVVLLTLFSILLIFSTLERNTHWKDSLTLFDHEVRINPGSAEAYYLLGSAYSDRDNDKRAIELYQKSIALNPDHFESHQNLGHQYMREGNLNQALYHYGEMFRINRYDHKAPFFLGHALATAGQYEQAHYYLRAAVAMKPMSTLYQQAISEVESILDQQSDPSLG